MKSRVVSIFLLFMILLSACSIRDTRGKVTIAENGQSDYTIKADMEDNNTRLAAEKLKTFIDGVSGSDISYNGPGKTIEFITDQALETGEYSVTVNNGGITIKASESLFLYMAVDDFIDDLRRTSKDSVVEFDDTYRLNKKHTSIDNSDLIPKYRETLYTHRVLQGYIIISLILLALLGLFYAMLLIIANSLNRNTKLQQENQFLAMQQSRYDNLKSAIEETKHARHDLRHHFTRLFAIAEDGDLEKMKTYILAAQESVPDLDMHFSDNRAVDSIIGHYCTLARREGIPFLSKIDLPDRLPVDEVDLCLVLSNLLENALEASLRIDAGKRQIIIETYMHSEHLVLIHIENAFDGNIKEKDGVFKSSKRKGNGVGIQSVRRIAEKNGGGSSFEYNDVTFTVNVMLRD